VCIYVYIYIMCGCVCLCVGGCVGGWLCGCVDVLWVGGCVGVLVCVCVRARACVYIPRPFCVAAANLYSTIPPAGRSTSTVHAILKSQRNSLTSSCKYNRIIGH
jgi:hypothetical protein